MKDIIFNQKSPHTQQRHRVVDLRKFAKHGDAPSHRTHHVQESREDGAVFYKSHHLQQKAQNQLHARNTTARRRERIDRRQHTHNQYSVEQLESRSQAGKKHTKTKGTQPHVGKKQEQEVITQKKASLRTGHKTVLFIGITLIVCSIVVGGIFLWRLWQQKSFSLPFLHKAEQQSEHNVQSPENVGDHRIAIGEEIAIGGAQEYDIDDDILWDNGGQTTVQRPDLENFRLVINTDALNIDVPIVNGVSLKSLAQGVGHHINTAYPNTERGNVVLSGHRWYPGDNPYFRALIDLDKLRIGDTIEVFYAGKKYVYRVDKREVVPPTQTSLLQQTEHPQLTLYTCTPKYTAKNRLAYIATLVDVQE